MTKKEDYRFLYTHTTLRTLPKVFYRKVKTWSCFTPSWMFETTKFN